VAAFIALTAFLIGLGFDIRAHGFVSEVNMMNLVYITVGGLGLGCLERFAPDRR